MQPLQLASLLSVISLVSAFPWPRSFPDKIYDIENLFRRQNNGNNGNNGNGATAQPSATSNAGTPKTTAGTATATGSITVTNAPSQSTGSGSIGTASGVFSGNITGTPMFDPRDPAGGVSMMSPNPMSGAEYYKIGDWVYFQWNYTSLQATPTAINVVASCSANNQVYTLAMNQSVQSTGAVYWDTGSYQQTAVNSLLTNKYTLVIWDAAKPMTATPSAGYLGTYNQFIFGMYNPQPYQNLSGK
jgi:hypothetical protein